MLPVLSTTYRTNMDTSNITVSEPLSLASLSANIVAELAAGLSDAAGIKQRYGISDAQWQSLKSNPVFRGMLAEAIRKFKGDLNAGKRITIKSEVALEDSIPLLHQWAHDNEIAIGNRLDAIKQMAVLAGRTGREANPAGQGGSAPGFSISITVQGTEKQAVITSNPPLVGTYEEVED